ncbi:protein scabrous [Drosophila eugracilis]|uniref:protein scabrous n=1 Tax=Drosophila eugracilis TaxID=29029 RepID=UPI001BD9DCC9|nr:protein scabrous [Drosophila eugracilis]
MKDCQTFQNPTKKEKKQHKNKVSREHLNCPATMAGSKVLRSIALAVVILHISVAIVSGAASNGVVLSDVNNMLRDAKVMTSEKPVMHINQETEAPESSVELLRFVDDDEDSEDLSSIEASTSNGRRSGMESKKMADQVRLLTKQLNALMLRRREDYEMLEHNLRKSLRLTTNTASVDADMRSELNQLREEVASLRSSQSGNKERLTVEWLQQTISEIRKQLVDLQRTAGNVARDVQQRSSTFEDLATIRSDYQQLKLELAAQRERQQQTEVYVQELREEMLQQEQDFQHALVKLQKRTSKNGQGSASVEEESASQEASQEPTGLEPSADHKRRHCRFQSEQIHQLQLAHRNLRRQVNGLKFHHIDERVRSIEVEQHRIANANFNLSSQIASLDKLHTSMLELLEDVEGLQTKMDKSIPELRHEISKLEFANAQITSEQSLIREEGTNAARSLQAMAVSVSVLQEEREGMRKLSANVDQLRTNVDRLQSLVNDELKNKLSHLNKPHKRPHHQNLQKETPQDDSPIDSVLAETLVSELENVETQYEAIINKLPHDCSEVHTQADGLHLIAPAGQRHPLMSHCTADGWTTVQRRFDGSADFNRSWADYAQGFGTPGGEFWIGNEQLHHLTLDNCSRLQVQMQDIYDNVWVAEYKRFYISSRSDGYRLHIAEYSGNASDALNYQQGMQFSAIDDDRDISQTHCAANYEGGWWFSHCQHANLNGRYNLGLTWFDAARNEWIAVKSSRMLVKRLPAVECQANLATVSVADTPAADAVAAPPSSTSAPPPPAATATVTVTTASTINKVVQFVAAGQA